MMAFAALVPLMKAPCALVRKRLDVL